MKSNKPTLGRLLRGLRQRNDWTLKEMSQRTGIPLSTLAKVEHDRLTLTYDKLQQLSERLKIRMGRADSRRAASKRPLSPIRAPGTAHRDRENRRRTRHGDSGSC